MMINKKNYRFKRGSQYYPPTTGNGFYLLWDKNFGADTANGGEIPGALILLMTQQHVIVHGDLAETEGDEIPSHYHEKRIPIIVRVGEDVLEPVYGAGWSRPLALNSHKVDADSSTGGICVISPSSTFEAFDTYAADIAIFDHKSKRWSAAVNTTMIDGSSPTIKDLAFGKHAMDNAAQHELIVAGEFRTIDNKRVNSIAMLWQNGSFSALEDKDGSAGVLESFGDYEEFDHNEGTVNRVVRIGHQVFVAGEFRQAGRVTVRNIALYDLSRREWQDLNRGINGKINDMTIFNDKLYVGGSFGRCGEKNCNNIASWNLKQRKWEPLNHVSCDLNLIAWQPFFF